MTNLFDIQDIYIIPSNVEDRYIIYSPMRGIIFWVSSKVAEVVKNYVVYGYAIPKEYIKLREHFKRLNEKEIFRPQEKQTISLNRVVFILSQRCNLACNYCYAQKSRSQSTLNKSKIKTIVDYVLSVPDNKIKSFSFIGGGEPTVTWNLFTWSVSYIKNVTKLSEINIGLTTNGTLLNDKRIKWLKKNNVHIGISFDILPEIQNSQRSFINNSKNSFEVIDCNIKLLTKNGLYPRIRSTITEQNVTLMPQMVQFVFAHYPEIKQLHFEPVTAIMRNETEFYSNFVSYFFEAKKMGRIYGIEIENSIIKSINRIKTSFCGGEFCIIPTGDIVSCHRVSSKIEKSFNDFCYGLVDNNKVHIDKEKFATIKKNDNGKYSQCNSCFAKWHCAGICENNRSVFSKKQFNEYCEFTKKMIITEFENKLNNVF